MLSSLRKNGLTSLFKEVRVLKVSRAGAKFSATTPSRGRPPPHRVVSGPKNLIFVLFFLAILKGMVKPIPKDLAVLKILRHDPENLFGLFLTFFSGYHGVGNFYLINSKKLQIGIGIGKFP